MKRDLLAHYVDIGMKTAIDAEDTNFHLLGEGVGALSEEFNPETETKQWINDKNGNTAIKSYTPSIEVEIEDCDQDDTELIDWLNDLVDDLPTGKDATSSYVRVRLNRPLDSAGTDAKVFKAVKRMCSISVSSTGGDAGSNVVNSISIGGKGDGKKGYFNIETNKFTVGEYKAEEVEGNEAAIEDDDATDVEEGTV